MPDAGEVIVKTQTTLISTGTELSILCPENYDKDSIWGKHQFPFTPGYNNIGVVVEVGPGVDKNLLGKKVACYGRHCQYAKVRAGGLYEINEGMKNESAVFFTLAQIVANGIRRGEIKWGDNVCVFGLGLLGQLAVRFARLSGAKPVIGIDVSDERISLLPEDKSIITINSLKENVQER